MNSQDWEQYIEWAEKVTKCDECKDLKKYLEKHLVSANFDEKVQPRPFPGYVGKNYQTKRILILGINPGGGKEDPNIHDKNFEILLRLFNDLKIKKDPKEREERIKDAMSKLQSNVERWNVIKLPFLLNCLNEASNELECDQIAYANQILCRTKERFTNFQKKNPCESEGVFQKCFCKHIRNLIEILHPNCIVAFGKTKKVPNSYWLKSLGDRTQKELKQKVQIIPIRHPFSIMGNKAIKWFADDIKNSWKALNLD